MIILKNKFLLVFVFSIILFSCLFLSKNILLDFIHFKKFTISGKSMEPTIKDKSTVFFDLNYYKNNTVNRNDIVAIRFTLSQDKIKRVIAVGGDRIEFKDGNIFVNNIPSPTKFIKDKNKVFDPSHLRIIKTQLGEGEIMPKDSLLVMGDNRMVSEDSQYFGLISTDQVMGKLVNIGFNY